MSYSAAVSTVLAVCVVPSSIRRRIRGCDIISVATYEEDMLHALVGIMIMSMIVNAPSSLSYEAKQIP